jgi:capsular exopolysaccharide synthesis family protein
MDAERTSMNIEQVLGVVRRRALLVLVCVLVTTLAAYVVSAQQRKKYTATASLAFNNAQLSQQAAGLQVTGGSESQQAQENTNVKLVQLGDTAEYTAVTLGGGLTADEVRKALSVEAQGESNIVSVAATASSPKLAAQIANTYSTRFVYEQQNANRSYYSSALTLVEKQLAALSPHQRAETAGLTLQARAQSLAVLAQLQAPTVRVAQEAARPRSPSSPNVSRSTILGVFVGLLLGLTVAFLLERFGRRISEPDDLSVVYRAPLLGVVPESSVLEAPLSQHGVKRAPLPPTEAEAFQLIRANLRYLNVDHELRSLLITSAAPGDGKTTVALHLALAAASVGSTVLLMETDLRNPSIAEQLDISAGPGIADVMVGSVSLPSAIQRFTIDASDGGAPGPLALHVLVAGARPPANPAELLESDAMRAVIALAKQTYDLVVIDTTPVGVLADAFPLLNRVDGVVLVGLIGRNRRTVAARLRETLDRVGAPVVGVIANGFKARWPRFSYPEYGCYDRARVAPLSAAFHPHDSAAEPAGSPAISPPGAQPAMGSARASKN